MTKPGPNTQPAAKKRREGNRGHRDIVDDIELPSDDALPPDWLDGEERATWYKLRPILVEASILKNTDNMMLAMLCYYEREHRDIVHALRDRSLTLISEKTGSEYQDPLVGIRNKTFDRIAKLCAVFGLSPSDRTRLGIEMNDAIGDELFELMEQLKEPKPN